MGLPYYRVLGSDAEQFEIELLREAEPDAKTVPPLGGRADYARDVVAAPASAAAADKPRRFDPSAFEGTPRVTAWDPRPGFASRSPGAPRPSRRRYSPQGSPGPSPGGAFPASTPCRLCPASPRWP